MAHDPVNHPKHYTSHPSGIECIQITRWLNFNAGNAVKYVWRAGDKGDLIEDLKKALWYLNDELKRIDLVPFNHQLVANVRPDDSLPDHYALALFMGFSKLGQSDRADIIFNILAAYEFDKTPRDFKTKLWSLNNAVARLKELIALEEQDRKAHQKQVDEAKVEVTNEAENFNRIMEGLEEVLDSANDRFTVGDLQELVHELATEGGLKRFNFHVNADGTYHFEVMY